MKEKFMDRWFLVIGISIVLILFGVGLSGFWYYYTSTINNSGDKACQEIGYEKYKFVSGGEPIGICIDSNGDYYYVEVILKKGLGVGIIKVKEIDENTFLKTLLGD